MALLIIVFSLALEFVIGRWQHLRRLVWVGPYRDFLFQRLPEDWTDGWRGLSVLLLPLVLLLVIVQYAAGGQLYGLLQLLLGIAVLTYCLGPEPFNELIGQYLDACEQHDSVRARAIAEKLLPGPIPQNIHQLSQQVTRVVFFEANKRMFAVIFWFLLLGPAGALLYRVLVYLAEGGDPDDHDQLVAAASGLHGMMDWLPVRLLALSFFLSGSFDDALDAWRNNRKLQTADIHERNRALVITTGCAAMRHEVEDLVEHPGEQETFDLQWLRTARVLLFRSVVIWLAAIAILTFAGVFV